MMKQISVIISTWNRSAGLARTLASLASQTLPADEWEVVVVNNNSTDDTAQVFARFAASVSGASGASDVVSGRRLDVRMVDERRQGLSWARNRGLAEARGGIVVMIDDDEEAVPGFLAAWCNFFATHPSAVAAGGPMRARYEEGRPHWMSHYTETLAASTIDLGPRARPFPLGRYPIGGNMAFRRAIFDCVGGFDTSLGRTGQALLGGEEKDMFERIAALDHGSVGPSDSSTLHGSVDDSCGGLTGGEIWWVPSAPVDHIIPPSRLTEAHFRKLSRMVGVTARLIATTRAPSPNTRYARAMAAEAIKWCATLVLAAWFVLTLRPSKARYLIIMRCEITRGLLSSGVDKP